MKFSVASQALYGAVSVSALAIQDIPDAIEDAVQDVVQSLLELTDVSNIQHFPTISPEDAHNSADQGLLDLFDAFGDLFSDKDDDDAAGQTTTTTTTTQTTSVDQTKSNAKTGGDEDAADEVKTNMKTAGNHTSASNQTDAGDDATTEGAAAATCDTKNPHVRVEWRNFAESDRLAFMDSIKCLLDAPSKSTSFPGSTNRYEDLVAVHHTMTPNIHGHAQFLLWHRYFVWIFENMLREECSFDRAMPWWDETLDSGNFSAAPLFTDAYFGPLPVRPSESQAYCINPPRLNGIRLHIGPGNSFTERCLSRGVNETQTGAVTTNFVNDCNARATYDEMRGCQELGPHAYGHNGVGGIMADVSSSVGDPIFFMHHTFVDHTYRIWQNANATRQSVVDGCVDSASPCTPITNDFVLSSMGLAPNVTAGEMINTLGGTLCYKYDH